MGCACKVTEQIDYLHKKYGDDQPTSKTTNIKGSILAKLENLFILILLLPVYPFIAIYVITKKKITIDKFLKPFIRNGRNK